MIKRTEWLTERINITQVIGNDLDNN